MRNRSHDQPKPLSLCSALSARLKNARPIPDGVPALEGRAEKQRGNPGSTPQQRFQRCENFAAPE